MRGPNWLRLGKKTDPEPRLKAPIWLGNRSNGEFYRAQTAAERRIEKLIMLKAEENAHRVGLERREFLSTAMGMATSLWAVNLAGCSSEESGSRAGGGSGGSAGARGAGGGRDAGVQLDASGSNGGYCMPEEAMLDEAAACSVLEGDEFIVDGHTHHFDPNGEWRSAGDPYLSDYSAFFDNMAANNFPDRTVRACSGPESMDCFTSDVYVREFFTESDTAMTVLTMWPSIPCTPAYQPTCGLLIRHEELAATRELVNRLASSQRMLTHVQIAANFDLEYHLALMEDACTRGVSAWKAYPGFGPTLDGGPAVGYRFEDDTGRVFIEKGIALGVPIFCAHKGLPGGPAYDHEANKPDDMAIVAKAYPDAQFVVFHSGLAAWGDANTPAEAEGPYDPSQAVPTGINILIRAMVENGVGPNENLYADLGTIWAIISNNPEMAGHVLGKLLKWVGEDNVLWGSDALPAEHAQAQIEKFRAFQIPDQLQQEFGYPALTADIKRKIFGLNAARLYGIDVEARRCQITKDQLSMNRRNLDGEFGGRRWAQRVPHGPRSRREFLAYLRMQGGMPG